MSSFEADVHADTSVDLATDPAIDLRSAASVGMIQKIDQWRAAMIQEIDQMTLEGTIQPAVRSTANVSGDNRLNHFSDSVNCGAVWCKTDNDVYMMKSTKADGVPYYACVLVFPDDMLVVAEQPHCVLIQFDEAIW